MPFTPPHSCGNQACRTPAPAGHTYCPACEAKRVPDPRHVDPAIAKLYNSKRWRETAALIRSKNPLCQFLADNGQQCTHASAVVHHLVDPKDNMLVFFDWNNLVAVCQEHHQGGQRGETQGYRYCHTVGVMGVVYTHGFLYPSWHEKFVPQESEFMVSSTTSAVGHAAILKALQEPI